MARAQYEPIGSGSTKLTFAKSFLAASKANGLKLSAISPAKLSGGVLTVPAVGGKFEPVAGNGTVEGDGALILSANGRHIPIKALKLRTSQTHSPFMAKVGGSQLKIATAKSVSVARAGFEEKVAVAGLRLSPTLATRLGKKLDLRQLFKPGVLIGAASTVAKPSTISLLEKGAATLTLDAGLIAKLRSLFVAVNPIFPAEHQGSVFTLPIFGGTIALDATTGRLETLGQLEFLQLGGGQVFWREPWLEPEAGAFTAELDVEPAPPYLGKAGRLTVGASVTSGPVVAEPTTRTVSAGSTLMISPSTAQIFEEAFARPLGKSGLFHEGEPLGVVSFTGYGQ